VTDLDLLVVVDAGTSTLLPLGEVAADRDVCATVELFLLTAAQTRRTASVATPVVSWHTSPSHQFSSVQ